MPFAKPSAPPPPRWLRGGLLFAVAAFVGWRVSDNTADNDLWGHVLYGQRMIHLHGLERTEVLSWTAAGQPWINHEVGAEFALGTTHLLLGGTGLWLLMMTLAVLTIGWAWRLGTAAPAANAVASAAILALTANAIALGYAVRPQLFTYLGFVALLAALRGWFAGRASRGFLIVALLGAWVNFHGGFLAGWLVLLLALGSEILGRIVPGLARALHCEPSPVPPWRQLALAAGGTLALLANPWGWHLLAWTLATVRLPRPEIAEWHPLLPSFATLPFYFAVGLGAAAWIVSRAPRRLGEIAVWGLCVALAVRAQRNAPLFGLASLVFLPPHLAELGRRLSGVTGGLRMALVQRTVAGLLALGLAVAGLACGAAALRRPHPFRIVVPDSLYPVDAIAFIRAEKLTGPTITFFDWGQQVLWELPDNPVSFDGRLDTVYPRELMDAHWRLYAGKDPGPALDVNRADVALLPTGSGGVAFLRQHGWSAAHVDPLATVLTRTRAAGPVHAGFAGGRTVPFPDAPPPLGRVASAGTPSP